MLSHSLFHQLAKTAQQAILYEVSIQPKPGLVNPNSPGAHSDMDFFTFLSSSTSLYEGLFQFAYNGYHFEGSSDEHFQSLRGLGMNCEDKMFLATNGINTHKGVIFSFATIVAATAKVLKQKKINLHEYRRDNTSDILAEVSCLTENLITNDLENLPSTAQLTNGEKLYKDYGILGIRGEVAKGFPTVANHALPYLRESQSQDVNTQLLCTLLTIMKHAEDSNIVNRGNLDTLKYVQTQADHLLNHCNNKQLLYKGLESLNHDFIQKNLSPGGSADLLCVTIYFALLENLIH
ncbi:triphosphoribosyl-dephospho-CoA synthase CitG [Amphibacillus jilinensis]|uniref:triphosphoribosyl-dephospho-CoA synthase CitG n=1 Tax=Amphibacillus jilinensis TaxID=1216008 RepID=UPI0003126CF1|nr:triphosphoribosyl-dephospho-CoA synthase CitG [Amphibacillus jilinensis]